MSRDARRTVAQSVDLSGVGLHTGATAHVTLSPAQSGTGILFVRADLPDAPRIVTAPSAVRHTDRRTTLGAADATVETVEHLLAAVFAMGIDDLVVRMDGPELPIFDGSAEPYSRALSRAGLVTLSGRKPQFRIRSPFSVQFNGSRYDARPCSGATVIDVQIDFDHPAIKRQRFRCDVNPDTFATALAGARTFGFASELASLRARGLVMGAAPGSAILLDDREVTHGAPLRWPDEFVRHKAVDLLGDLALLGGSIEGEITAIHPGHDANARFVAALQDRCR